MYRHLRTKLHTTSRIFSPLPGNRRPLENAPALLDKWRVAFGAYLEADELDAPALRQLSSQVFLADGGRLHTLAFLMAAPRTPRRRADELIGSDVSAFRYIGHVARLAYYYETPAPEAFPDYIASQAFVTARLQRSLADGNEVALLSQELRILRDSDDIFDAPLKGAIGVPVAQLFASSDSSDLLRDEAGMVLTSMEDCGIMGEAVLAEYVDSLRANVNDAPDQYFGAGAIQTEIHAVGKVASHMNSALLRESFGVLFSIPAVGRMYPSLSAVAAAGGGGAMRRPAAHGRAAWRIAFDAAGVKRGTRTACHRMTVAAVVDVRDRRNVATCREVIRWPIDSLRYGAGGSRWRGAARGPGRGPDTRLDCRRPGTIRNAHAGPGRRDRRERPSRGESRRAARAGSGRRRPGSSSRRCTQPSPPTAKPPSSACGCEKRRSTRSCWACAEEAYPLRELIAAIYRTGNAHRHPARNRELNRLARAR